METAVSKHPRRYVMGLLHSFLHDQQTDEHEPATLFILSAPVGTGKSVSVTDFLLSTFPQNIKPYFRFEFPAGGGQRSLSCTSFLRELVHALINHFGEDVIFGSGPLAGTGKRHHVDNLDAWTLFRLYVLRPLINVLPAKNSSTLLVPFLVVVDAPERCDKGDRALLRHLLCCLSSDVEPHVLRVVIVTSDSAPFSFGLPLNLATESFDLAKVKLVSRLSPTQNDQVIRLLIEDSLISKGVDIEWETDLVDKLERTCGGSLLAASCMISKGNDANQFFFESVGAFLETEFQDWFGPFMCAREKPNLEYENNPLLLKSVSQAEFESKLAVLRILLGCPAVIDWFSASDRGRYRQLGHKAALGRLRECLDSSDYAVRNVMFHASEAGETELGRDVLVNFDFLRRYAASNVDQLIRDADEYCSRRSKDLACRVIRNCLVQAHRALKHDHRQLPFQLLARITGIATDVRGDVEISNLLDAARRVRYMDAIWLKPARASMALVPETTLKVMRGHSDSVLCVSLSGLDTPWPRMALTGSCDGNAKLWDLLSGQCVLTLASDAGTGYIAGVALICLNENNIVSLTCGQDGVGRVWSLDRSKGFVNISGEPQLLIGHEKELTGCCFPPGNPRICATSSADNTARIWTLPLHADAKEVPKCLQVLRGHIQPVLCISFIPAYADILATGSKDRTVRLWKVSNGDCISSFGGHFSNVTCISFRSDGVVFATGGWDSIVKVWSVSEALNAQLVDPGNDDADQAAVHERCMLVHKDWIWCVAFVEGDNDLLCTGADNGSVRVWSISSSQCVLAFDSHLGSGCYCLAVLGSDLLCTAGIDTTLRFFDISSERKTNKSNLIGVESWSSVDSPHRFLDTVTAAAFPAQNLRTRLCILGDAGSNLKAFDLSTGRCVKTMAACTSDNKVGIADILVSVDQSKLLSLDTHGSSTQWDRSTLEPIPKSSLDLLCGCLTSNLKRFSPTAVKLNSGCSNGILQPGPDLLNILDLDEDAPHEIVPVVFDSREVLACWISPPIVVQQSDTFAEAVLVVVESNGLVHVLHPIF